MTAKRRCVSADGWRSRISYSSPEEANKARIKLRAFKEEPTLRVYACRFCGGWHVTSQPARRR